MNKTLLVLSVIALCVVAAQVALAGDDEHDWADPLSEPPRRKARLRSGLGAVDFPITCRRHETQRFFNQAVALFHGFDSRGAERCFRHASHLEPDCAMPYWGMALLNLEKPERAKRFIDRAIRFGPRVSRRERRWIDALATCLSDSKRVVEMFRRLAVDHPDDIEAAAFYVHQVVDGSQPASVVGERDRVDRLIRRVLDAQPEHPIHGSRARLWRSADPARAIAFAERAIAVAPANPYLRKLAGELHSRQGRVAESIDCLTRALELFAKRRARDRAMPDEIPGYADAKERLASDLARAGRVRDAIRIARQMTRAPCSRASTVDLHLAPDPESHRVSGVRRLAALLAEFERWEELDAWAPRVRFRGLEIGVELSYALGRAAVARHRLDDAEHQLARLRYFYAEAVDQAFLGGGHKHGHIRDEERAAQVLPRRVDYVQTRIRKLLRLRALAPDEKAEAPKHVAPCGTESGSAASSGWERWTWQPKKAPAFALPDARGRSWRLDDLRGRPVMIVFYLGAGCPHCIEQLQGLIPAKHWFDDAGIRILAVSTDNVQGLERTHRIAGTDELPFPIVSDESLRAFRAFGVIDEFEDTPLHGTFLIDRHGRVVWRNISVDPFMDFGFLLSESRHLLGSPKSPPKGQSNALENS